MLGKGDFLLYRALAADESSHEKAMEALLRAAGYGNIDAKTALLGAELEEMNLTEPLRERAVKAKQENAGSVVQNIQRRIQNGTATVDD